MINPLITLKSETDSDFKVVSSSGIALIDRDDEKVAACLII